eukprot:gene2778-3652_t
MAFKRSAVRFRLAPPSHPSPTFTDDANRSEMAAAGQQARGQQMPLTDTTIRNAKPSAAVVKLSDGAGLQLWIMPTGAKLWRLAYRFGGKQKKLSIGPYPEIDLRSA